MNISLWGGLLVLLLLAAAVAVVSLVDRRLLAKAARVGIHVPRLSPQLWLVTGAAMLLVTAAMAGCLMLSLPCRTFLPVASMVFIVLGLSVPRATLAYRRSLVHTASHRLYLLANGATRLESLMPSVRRALRWALMPVLWGRRSVVVVALPLFFCGLLISGMTMAVALAVTLLLWATAIVASVLCCLLVLWLADFVLFDKDGRLTGQGETP